MVGDRVPVVGRGNHDRVDILAVENPAKVAVGLGLPTRRRLGAAQVGLVDVADRGDRDVGERLESIDQPGAHAADADEPKDDPIGRRHRRNRHASGLSRGCAEIALIAGFPGCFGLCDRECRGRQKLAPSPIVHLPPFFPSSLFCKHLNALARSWEAEPPGEPRRNPARTEPRPPGITQGRLVFIWIEELEVKPLTGNSAAQWARDVTPRARTTYNAFIRIQGSLPA